MRENPNFILQCLKITEKVSFDILNEASNIYFLSWQKFIENAKNGQFWRVFGKPEACGQTVLPDRSILIEKKNGANTKIEKFKYDIFDDFQTLWNFSLGKKGQMRHFKEFSNALNILFADLISSSKCLSSISIPHTFNLDWVDVNS